jgi:tetratricopeptide (TPR) repeat protein
MVKPTRKILQKILSNAFDQDSLVTIVIAANKLLEIDPDNSKVLLQLGSALYRMSRFDEAIDVIEKAMGYLPYDRMYLAYLYMGDVFKCQGKYDEACEWYQKVIEVRPYDTDGYIYQGSAFARQGKLVEAERLHRMGIECDEGCIDEAYYNLGLVLRAQDKLEEARECFEKTLELDPHFDNVNNQLKDVIKAMSLLSEYNA